MIFTAMAEWSRNSYFILCSNTAIIIMFSCCFFFTLEKHFLNILVNEWSSFIWPYICILIQLLFMSSLKSCSWSSGICCHHHLTDFLLSPYCIKLTCSIRKLQEGRHIITWLGWVFLFIKVPLAGLVDNVTRKLLLDLC